MKVTKRQLRRIIREERARLLEMLGTQEQQDAAAEYVRNRRRGEKPKSNPDFLRRDPGDEDKAMDPTPADDFYEHLEAGWRRGRGWGLSVQELGNIAERFIADMGYEG